MSPGNDERRPSGGRRNVEQTGEVTPDDTPTARAVQHIAAVRRAHPHLVEVDDTTWTAAIVQHLTPLPADRPWRLQRARSRPTAVRALAPAVARTFTPPAGTRPQPTCPTSCFVTHAYEDEQVSA